MKIVPLHVKDDWTSHKLEVDTILRYVGKSYEHDKMLTLYCFEVIGNPVEGHTPVEIILT